MAMLDLGVPIDVDKGAASFPTIPANNPGGGSGVKPASVRNTPTHNPCIHMNNFENLGSIGDRFQSGKLHGVAPAQILTELEARNGMEPVAGHAGKTQAVVMLNDRFLGNPPPHDHGTAPITIKNITTTLYVMVTKNASSGPGLMGGIGRGIKKLVQRAPGGLGRGADGPLEPAERASLDQPRYHQLGAPDAGQSGLHRQELASSERGHRGHRGHGARAVDAARGRVLRHKSYIFVQQIQQWKHKRAPPRLE